MTESPEDRLERALERAISEARVGPPCRADRPLSPGSSLTAERAVALFEAQLLSRQIDLAARRLRAAGSGYYTIQSAGHEQNAVLGALLRLGDPCLLHYRSGALMLARAQQAPEIDVVLDTLYGVCAAREDPIAGGRHKVFGSVPLRVIPQTSTIASQLPKAVGLAFAHERALRLGSGSRLENDAIVCCSFGDASANHASALTAIHSARYARRRGNPVPILFVCEDNGLGISVATPRRWVKESFSNLPYLHYVEAQGDLCALFGAAERAIRLCRTAREPVFLHLACVRLFGHAGSDVEGAYRDPDEIARDEARDPLPQNARFLCGAGAASPEQLFALLGGARRRVSLAAERAALAPKLPDLAAVSAPLALGGFEPARAALSRRALAREATSTLPPSRRTLAARIQATLAEELELRPELVLFGEDVARKGGVYHVTADLWRRFGGERVFDTLLDETTILGVAQGAALAGLLPIAEIQYLAYLHNAIDQLRGEAASLPFFSAGQYATPLVLRVASFAYQRGFGGHFHSENAVGALREIPGLLLAVPARAHEAPGLLRASLALARSCGRIVCMLEPIALYHEKDLHEPGDGLWLAGESEPQALWPGELGVYEAARSPELLIVSYGNGLRFSLRAQRTLERDHSIFARVVDLRWLAPLPREALLAHARECGRALFADECRASGGVADALVAALAEGGFPGPIASLRSADSFIPLGPAAEHVLLAERDIVAAALRLVSRGS